MITSLNYFSEPGAGVCSISKVLIVLNSGKIPPNIHYKTPKPEITGLVEGRMKVVDEVCDFKGSLVGCNSFGFGGK